MRYASNKILNSIASNPNNINKYKFWQIKIYGKYTNQWLVGSNYHGDAKGVAYKLNGKGNINLIPWYPRVVTMVMFLIGKLVFQN